MRLTLLLAVVVTSALTACAPQQPAVSRPRDAGRIAQEEVDASLQATAYDVIVQLRPNFFMSRGSTSLRPGEDSRLPWVFLDGVEQGPIATLRSIPALERRRDPAVPRMGGDHAVRNRLHVRRHSDQDAPLIFRDDTTRRLRVPLDEKPSRNEDEYWAKVDADLIKSRRAALDAEREQARKSEQQNKCPRCCVDLKEREYHHVKIDECPQCGGVWLDKGELQMLEHVPRDKSGGFIGSLFGLK